MKVGRSRQVLLGQSETTHDLLKVPPDDDPWLHGENADGHSQKGPEPITFSTVSQPERSTHGTDLALSALIEAAEKAGLAKEDIAVEPVDQSPGMYFLKLKGEREQRNRLEPVVVVGDTRLELMGVRAEDGATVLTYRVVA